ncbi:thiol-disulfide oxidoreductase DCC family protein [Streptomyces sp. NPDC018610]|uniref:thiol-disulfide oxidoreductase DCC family protein n=1 Tax=Streptomyces sp. NPDC018610 TaxID=3365049 RepID=UPI0037889147
MRPQRTQRPDRVPRTRRPRPVLVYDGDCGFCTASVTFAQRHVRPRCDVLPWQSLPLDEYGVTQERAEYEALWVTPAGTVYGGAQAVAKALLSAGGPWSLPGALLTLPPFRWAAHAAYRLVAENRHRLPGSTAACAVPPRRSGNR